MLFLGHLRENALGDIIVATPVGRTLGKGELVEIMTARFPREPVCDLATCGAAIRPLLAVRPR